ncbi:MAG: hypothetical protein V4473_02930 [Patescibacteria group bacterium]
MTRQTANDLIVDLRTKAVYSHQQKVDFFRGLTDMFEMLVLRAVNQGQRLLATPALEYHREFKAFFETVPIITQRDTLPFVMVLYRKCYVSPKLTVKERRWFQKNLDEFQAKLEMRRGFNPTCEFDADPAVVRAFKDVICPSGR